MGAFALGMHIRFLAKASLFRPPFGALMRWLGGVAVDRERAGNTDKRQQTLLYRTNQSFGGGGGGGGL